MTESLTFDQLSTLFHMPLSDAAKQIGICCTALKKACRKNNISRWPHRKIKSLDRMIEALEIKLGEVIDNDEIDKTRVELEYYKNQRALIMKNSQKNLTGLDLKIQKSNAISKSSRSNNIQLSSPSSSSPSTIPSPQVFTFKPSSPSSSGSSSSTSSHPVSPNSSLECSLLGIPTSDFDLFLDSTSIHPSSGSFSQFHSLPTPAAHTAVSPVSAVLPPSSNGIYFYPPQTVDQKGFPFVHPQLVYNFAGFPSGAQQPQSLPMMTFPHNANFLVPFGYPVQFGHSFGTNEAFPPNSSLAYSPLPFTANPNPSTSSVITAGETPSSPNFVPSHPEIYDSSFPTDFIFCQ